MGTLGRTWNLCKRSFDILCADVEIVLFPVMSAISAVLLAAGFFYPLFRNGMLESMARRTAGWDAYAALFAWYCLNCFIIMFFNSALVGCANVRLSGGNPGVGDGIRIACRHIRKIASWALVAATVGVILDSLRNKANKVIGRLLTARIGLAWTLITYLIIPVIILEDRTTYASMQRSAELFRKRWGEEVAGSFGFGITNMLPLVTALALAWLLFSFDRALAVIMFIWYVIILAAIGSAVKGIFTVVLYRYATAGELPSSFSGRLIDDVLRSRSRSVTDL